MHQFKIVGRETVYLIDIEKLIKTFCIRGTKAQNSEGQNFYLKNFNSEKRGSELD